MSDNRTTQINPADGRPTLPTDEAIVEDDFDPQSPAQGSQSALDQDAVIEGSQPGGPLR